MRPKHVTRNPKTKHFTPEQEQRLAFSEDCRFRAQILEIGCASVLKANEEPGGYYCNTDNLAVVVKTLEEARNLRLQAQMNIDYVIRPIARARNQAARKAWKTRKQKKPEPQVKHPRKMPRP